MKTFYLIKDKKVSIWTRDYFEVDTETLEEAIEKVKNEDIDSYSYEYLDDTIEPLGWHKEGTPTEEIIDEESGKTLWNDISGKQE